MNQSKHKEIKDLAAKASVKLSVDESNVLEPFIIKGNSYTEYDARRLIIGTIDGWLSTEDVRKLMI